MQKKKWILEIGIDVLEKHGFTFVESNRKDFWYFEREVDGITQRIELQDESFLDVGTKKRALIAWISTSAYGSKLPLDILRFIPKERLPKPIDMLEEFYKGVVEEVCKGTAQKELPKDLKYWSYQDVDSFKSSLKSLMLLTEAYGLPELTRLSVESEIIPTIEMGTKLASLHEELSEKFIQENQLNVSNSLKETMITWFEVIEQKIKVTKNETYQNVQGMLIEITAFLGEQLRKEVGGEWIVGVEPRIIFIRNMNVFATTSYSPFELVIGSWKYQDINWLKERYFLFMESKLPVTQEFMRNFNKRQEEIDKLKYPAL